VNKSEGFRARQISRNSAAPGEPRRRGISISISFYACIPFLAIPIPALHIPLAFSHESSLELELEATPGSLSTHAFGTAKEQGMFLPGKT
jgi:hypothetical protein